MDKDQVIKTQRQIIANHERIDALSQKRTAAFRACASSLADGVDLATQLLAGGRHEELKTHLEALADQAVRLIETAG